MRTVGVLVALIGALVLQTTLAGFTVAKASPVNLVLVAVVYVALAFGPVAGLLAGAFGGLVQDSLAGGVIGVGGLAKTLVGFAVGALGAHFIVAQTVPRFVMFFGATLVHELCYQSLFAAVEGRPLALHYTSLLAQAGVNALIGVLAFQVVENGPGLLQRRRARGSSLSSRRY